MTEPLVTVVVPVHNGERYLRECLQSVLVQTYRNWRLVVVNNGSTDGTAEIAAGYAERDARVSVHTTERLLPVIQNHNYTIGFLDPEAKYCKPLMADDWFFPDCLSRMVALAERNPSVGLVAAYAFDGSRVMWGGGGPAYPADCIAGNTVSRASLLGDYYAFGTPSTVLYRADLVRKRPKFYNENNINADVEACYEVLAESDFGFLHQVLTFNRVHEHSQTAALQSFDALSLGTLQAFNRFGHVYLSESEFETRREEMLRGYYRLLAKNALRLRGSSFWTQQRARLDAAGEQLSKGRLARAIGGQFLRGIGRPFDSLSGVASSIARRLTRDRGHSRAKTPGDGSRSV